MELLDDTKQSFLHQYHTFLEETAKFIVWGPLNQDEPDPNDVFLQKKAPLEVIQIAVYGPYDYSSIIRFGEYCYANKIWRHPLS